MKYFILFNIFAIVIFILLILSRPLHMTMDIKNNNADKLDNIRNILVYVSCAMSFLCLGLLELSIKTKENPLIRPVSEKIHIYSDGEYISYKGIVMDKFKRRTLVSYNEKYIIGLFPTRNLILILGHFGYGSTIINLEFK